MLCNFPPSCRAPRVACRVLWLFIGAVLLLSTSAETAASRLDALVGSRDGVVLADPNGKTLYAKNADSQLVPASILKILTSTMALESLGDDFRFKTEFYLDAQENLKIKGFGDPLLISEVIASIARIIGEKLTHYADLILDDSFFASPLTIPGVSDTANPYDAPNGALCANFNTVYFKKNGGKLETAEDQTPLLPFAKRIIGSSPSFTGRVVIPSENAQITTYAGHLFQYFLDCAGVKSKGKVRLGRIDEKTDRLVYRHFSPFTLPQAASRLMRFSNNYMANQLFITVGALRFGPPGTMGKGVLAARAFIDSAFDRDDIHIVEGSGISRQNRVTPNAMLAILDRFKPHATLLRRGDNEWFKTGSLSGVRTRAGFIEGPHGALYPFAVLLNTPGKTTDRIMRELHKAVDRTDE